MATTWPPSVLLVPTVMGTNSPLLFATMVHLARIVDTRLLLLTNPEQLCMFFHVIRRTVSECFVYIPEMV